MNRRRYWVLATLLVLLTVSLAAKKQKQTHAPDDPKRALHALDRLTFGPRPGDVQAVAAMGVDKWIDLQLHPEQINDTAMQSRLAGYRTLQMSTREMVLAFPPNPIVKAVMDGKMAMPRDPNRRCHLRRGDRSRTGEASSRNKTQRLTPMQPPALRRLPQRKLRLVARS